MAQSSGMHGSLRQEWVEMPPDVSYRFVVSLDTLQAADAALRSTAQNKENWLQRAVALFLRDIRRLILGALIVALVGWISLQFALVVDRAAGGTQYLGSRAFLPIVAFLVVFSGLYAGLHVASRRVTKLSFLRLYREYFSNNEFLVEGRKSHLWFDEQSAGAIRRWSSFERLIEFEQGMWLLLRRRTTFAGLRGILISKESLPGSCAWNELKTYLSQRVAESASDETAMRDSSSDLAAS